MRIERTQRAIDAARELVKKNFPEDRNIDGPLIVATAILITLTSVVDAIDNLDPR